MAGDNMFLIIRKKTLIVSILCSALLFTTLTIVGMSKRSIIASTNPSTNWGLNFKSDGTPPIGNATSEFLKQYNSFYIGNTNEKKIYLTFDAGFENGYTPTILDILKKHKVPATFFVVGNYIKKNPELVKRMINEGHIVGNHTFTHPDMSKIAEFDSFKHEVESLENLFKECTGKDIKKFYRPPQGKYCENNLKQAHELGYKTIFWSLAYVDWLVDKQPTKESAMEKLTKRIHPGAIVLLHSTSKTNCEILDELLTKWEKDGYTFSSLEQLA